MNFQGICFCFFFLGGSTADGGNPAPPGMYETLSKIGIFTISTGAGFCPSTVGWVLGFFSRTSSQFER